MSNANSKPHSPGADCAYAELCPLHDVEAGQCALIRRLDASPELSHRLREMGLCEDQQVRLVRKDDSVICQVCNARLGLSPELARRILVQRVAPPKKAA